MCRGSPDASRGRRRAFSVRRSVALSPRGEGEGIECTVGHARHAKKKDRPEAVFGLLLAGYHVAPVAEIRARRRQARTPTPQNPRSNIAQVEGSGTAPTGPLT